MLRKSRAGNSSHPNFASNATSPSSSSAHQALRRRRKENECMLKLERVLGLTSNKPMILSVNTTHDLIAYAAGCVVVLYNHKLDKQVGLLCGATLSKAAADSGSGSGAGPGGLLVPGTRGSTGSSPRTSGNIQWMNSSLSGPNINPLAGLMPMNLSDPSVTSSFGTSNSSSNKNVKSKPISSLAFSPDGQYLAVGEMGHQPKILIWEVATQMLVGELQGHTFGVQAVQFSPNSKYLVSLGFQHDGFLHVWNWVTNTQIASNKVSSKVNSLVFSTDGSYFVTAGLRHIKFWYLNIGSSKRSGTSNMAPNIQVLDGRPGILRELRDSNYVDVACSQDGRYTYAVTSNGILCLFSEDRSLEKWIKLHATGAYSVNLDERSVICGCTDGYIRLFEQENLEYIGTLSKPPPIGTFEGAMYGDVHGEETLKGVYADVLATQYDSSSGSLICIYSDRSLVVWDINDKSNATVSRSHMFHSDCVWGVEVIPTANSDDRGHNFPPDTFVTYSADGSIKFWNLDESMSYLAPTSDVGQRDPEPISMTAPTSREILRVLYVDGNCKSLIKAPDIQDGQEPDFNSVPLEYGVRTVKISSDGRFLASGDKRGNLRVHSLSTFEQLTYQEAHDTEILAIDFTDPQQKGSPLLVATAGRDRLLHVFDVYNDYSLVQTLADHSSSITCIKFTADGSRMISCGADKSIIFRNCHKVPGRATFYDMGLHHPSQTLAVVSGDRRFNAFTLDSGKPIRSFKAEPKGDDLAVGMAEICSMTHISLDPSGTIAAASGSDKSVRVYDLLNGICLAHMIYHSELVTSVKFTNGFDRIISTSADGCVLVWRLSKDIVRKIQSRAQENVSLQSYIQAKAVKKLSIPNARGNGASPKGLKLQRSTDTLGAYGSETSGPSRRNSTASMMSEDNDVRSEDNSDNIGGKDSRPEEATRESFTPVTVAKRPTSVRTRVTTGSSLKTPVGRSRQNSVSQSSIPKSLASSSRSGAQPELPPWNKHVVKDRVVPSPSSAKYSRPSSPRQRVASKTTIKGQWLAVSNARPRATSLGVPNERAPHLDRVKTRAMAQDGHSLSDYSNMDPMPLKGKGIEDDEMSDATESGFEDALDLSSCDPSTARIPAASINLLSVESRAADTDDVKPHVRAHTADGARLSSESKKEAYPTQNLSSADEDVGSDERDDDGDEEADEHESISETGSDSECLMSLQSDVLLSPGRGTIGRSASFQEGELLRASSTSGRNSQVTSPTSRTASTILSSRNSLSSKFLIAHAATIMMGLTMQQPAQESTISCAKKDSEENLSLDIGSNCATPKPTPTQGASQRILTPDNSAGSGLGSQEASPHIKENESLQTQQRHGHIQSVSRSDDYAKEVERTRKRLIEMGYLSSPGGTREPSSIPPLNSTDTSRKTSSASTKLQLTTRLTAPTGSNGSSDNLTSSSLGTVLRRVLASPAVVQSPESYREPESLKNTNGDSMTEGSNNDSLDEKGLQAVFERISSLIAHKYQQAGSIASLGIKGHERMSADRVQETKAWMKETREGLLNLVGEVQGHLWALEKETVLHDAGSTEHAAVTKNREE
ncbi:mitogen-activated protein kinase binding protein 1 [Haplosporangium sp. Z 767]|nr:mitogen-activated protein kinase binding protein 1 [Haplosporangium sp. Z 767]